MLTISNNDQHVECCAGAQRLLRLSQPSVSLAKSIGMHDEYDDTNWADRPRFQVKAYTIYAYSDSYTHRNEAIIVAPVQLLGVLLP